MQNLTVRIRLCFSRWGEIRHDPTVTWLAFWHDPISPKDFKYVFLAPSSSWKGQSDMEKYEKARKLKVRRTATSPVTSVWEPQRSVATTG